MAKNKSAIRLQNRVLAGIFGGTLLLAGIALLVVGAIMYLPQYNQYKGLKYEEVSCIVVGTKIEEKDYSYGSSSIYTLIAEVNYSTLRNESRQGVVEYESYSNEAPAKAAATKLELLGQFKCYYNEAEDNPYRTPPDASDFLAAGIGMVASGIMALLGGIALGIYLIVSFAKEQLRVTKLSKHTVTSFTPQKSKANLFQLA